ncbi:Nop14-like protein [Glonium stellatum]|uniref:Nop14-like protein n=1 Tax=Glonium stellatum TaxID=574774 RepID=A0A8E2F951_9PEZI|nr:Nop14-like protein [Glonium stellatum]
MPPSQLKRLKESLREQGITGPERGKKQKKKSYEANSNSRTQRNTALSRTRESFNPFEFKTVARPKKFEVTMNRPNAPKDKIGRPGATKSLGEEIRRRTLLPEMSKRNKVGGILDRRIGENDPTMTPDERMLERFTREKQRMKGSLLFDLEEAGDEEELTHLGRSLSSRKEVMRTDDYDAASVQASSDDDDTGTAQSHKRRKSPSVGVDGLSGNTEGEQPKRKKSKAEIMKEVIAKSKFYKHERQLAKEEDDDLREELDKDLPDVLVALRGHLNLLHPLPQPFPKEAPANDFSINPDRAAFVNDISKKNADKEYDERVRQMLFDQRSKPTERTKTEDERAEEEATLLKDREEQRLRRMRGDPDEDAQKNQNDCNRGVEEEEDNITYDEPEDDAAEFGFSGISHGSRPVGIDDEDDFLVDDYTVDNLSESETELSESNYGVDGGDDARNLDDEFLTDILLEDERNSGDSLTIGSAQNFSQVSGLAYTYPCPRSHEDLLKVLEDVPISATPIIVQRIRALYHPKLRPENKEMLADFAVALVNHLAYMPSQKLCPPLAITETLIRHIHSLSRTFPDRIAREFRSHLQYLHNTNKPTPGDLIILTAIGSIYPTSDHFHQVVTPAITLMARWLGMTSPKNVEDLAIGAYLGALCLQYQKLSKRYMPELVRFTFLALGSPLKTTDLTEAHIRNLGAMADLWFSKSAFTEIFAQDAIETLSILKQKKAYQRLQILLSQAQLARRPLELHHHRPLPIKTAIPKFEEGFNPDKHYDPDRDRADASKLRAEYKRERKGALRELRKDANFIAREKLKEKKEKDRAYEAKYKRLVAEIQGEEGREKNAYDREKRARKEKR